MAISKNRQQNTLFSTIVFKTLLILLPVALSAQIETKIDTTHIKIGEPIHYSLSVLSKNSSKIQLPVIGDTLSKHIEVINKKLDTVKEGNDYKLVQKLTLTSFDSGEFLIRSLPVVVNNDTLLSHSFQIQVDEVKIDSANLNGFPIKPIMEESYTWIDYLRKYKFEIALILVLVMATTTILWWLKHRKKLKQAKTFIQKTPYEEAMDALSVLDSKEYIKEGQIKPYYSDLSFLLRRYLGRNFNFSSFELLSDDLVEHFNDTNEISSNEISRLKQFLFDSDLVKFAKAKPDEDRHDFYRKWVEELIEITKPIEITEAEDDRNNQKGKK